LEEADIITLHVPLQHEGPDKTFHLANRDFFKKLKRNPIFINTCRGEVTNATALKEAIEKERISGAIIDCWENEPHLDQELMRMVDIATPHIAGYSRDGKANGTTMCVQAISRFFKLGIDNWNAEATEAPANPIITLEENESDLLKLVTQAVLTTYPIWKDYEQLLHSPEAFEKQRGDYPVRREYRAYTIKGGNAEARSVLKELGFKIEA
ncbi:MAG: DUF3410 domain-containing protein, partial [Bacteroidota bacterium]|nr:DUF3410 domain-containing protein [Bacteroidota bacterium]